MNITEFSLKNHVVTWLAVVILLLGGISSYFSLGKLEDPEFTIKTASIVTQYPGASPKQVEKEVTEVIELAIQEIPEIDYIDSISRQGLSIIKVQVQARFWSEKLPQIWDTLRRKIRNIEASLPQGVSRPDVRDDFGDVYGFVLAITGEGYSYKELEDHVKTIKRKLSLIEGVSRVEFWGKQSRAIYLKVKESKMAKLGVTIADISAALSKQNAITSSGHLYFDNRKSRIEFTGFLDTLEDIKNVTVRASLTAENSLDSRSGELIKIKDIADVEEGVIDPAIETMRYNGVPALGLAISNAPGTNIIEIGEALTQRLETLKEEIPVGIETYKVSWQAEEVKKAIDSFIISLIEAVVIVLLVLTVSMGWRMGFIIGTALVLTILGTLIFLNILGIDLHRMSLGALIVAMGMMVDNSIVVADGIMVRMQKGMDAFKAAVEAATKPSMPLLGATVIAVLAFYPIGGSTESVGEYCLALLQVVGISLMFSWLVSITVTPIQCVAMLKVEQHKEGEAPVSSFFKHYKHVLETAIRHRYITLLIMFAMLALAMVGFKCVPQMFFPDSSRPQFMIDMYAPNGTRVQTSSALLKKAEQKVMQLDGVDAVSTFVASGPPRFYLPVEPEMFFESYGQLIVNVDDFRKIDGMIAELQPWLDENFPEVPVFRVRKYAVGPGNTWKFEARVIAPADATLSEIRQVGERGLEILQENNNVAYAQVEWREKVKKAVVDYNQDRGRWAHVTKQSVADATRRAFDGKPVAQFRDGEDILPILLRNEAAEREDPSSLYTIHVPQEGLMQGVPLTEVVTDIHMEWEEPYVYRRDRQRVIAIQAEPYTGITLTEVIRSIKPQWEAFQASLPVGYSLEWGGEKESSDDSQKSLVPGMVPAVVLMFFIIVLLFNAMKPAFIIFLTIPLCIIGITAGLLTTGAAFGFMALLGAMSLAGMMIKNAIVLIDEIKLNQEEKGLTPYDAVIQAGMSRLRPVALASATTVLGVIPLIQDVFWVSMAVTIMAGLAFGTVLTMIVVPVLYAIFYNIRK